jgi:RTX calcium-binding nonapeptide repeat (4 copies)
VASLAALGLVAFPAGAAASTVQLAGGTFGDVLDYQADPGEANKLTIQESASVYSIEDLGVFTTPINAIPPCSSGGTGTASCPSTTVTAVSVALGDGDDRAAVDALKSATMRGGTGNDDLKGTGVDDFLFGEDGNDTLDGAGGTDVLNGGPGVDTAYYKFRANAVTVTLDGLADDGEGGGEADNVLEVENIVGGDGPDILSGDAGANAISGGPDNDKLDGGAGADVLDGGTEDDTISARDGTRDTVACGPGNDVAVVDTVDDVATDCEVVDRPAGPPPTQPADPPATVIPPLTPLISLVSSRVPTLTANRKGVVPVKLRCSRSTTTAKRCAGTIALEMTIHPPAVQWRPERRRASEARHKRRRLNLRLARRRFAVPAGHTRKVPLRLVASARRRLNRCRRLRVRIVVSSRDARGRTRKVTRKAILRSARGAPRPARRYVCS